MTAPFAQNQQFQNAGQHGSFTYSYNSVGKNTWVFPVLILSFVILIAFLRSEARYRALLEQIASGQEYRRLPTTRPAHVMRRPTKMNRRR